METRVKGSAFVSKTVIPASFTLIAVLFVVPAGLEAQQVLLDAGVQAGELMVFPTLGRDLEPGSDYYYVPARARLARDQQGRPQFSFLRYSDVDRPDDGEETAREGEGGGIVHAVVELAVDDNEVRRAENELGRLRPGARIVGPVIYRSGTFGLVSSFLEENGELTHRVVGLGSAPVLEGSRAAISMRLTKLGAKILWESFEMPTPDISFVFEMEVEGLRAPQRARLEADWDRIYKHQAFQAGVAGTLLAGEVSAAFDDLRDQGAIRMVQVGDDAQMDKLVQIAYDRLTKLMLEPIEGTGTPSLGALAGGGGLLDRATKMLAAARSEAAKAQTTVAKTPTAKPATHSPKPSTAKPDDDPDAEHKPSATPNEPKEPPAKIEEPAKPDADNTPSESVESETTEVPSGVETGDSSSPAVSAGNTARLHSAVIFGEELSRFLAFYVGTQSEAAKIWHREIGNYEAEWLEEDPTGEAGALSSATLQAMGTAADLAENEGRTAGSEAVEIQAQAANLRTALARQGIAQRGVDESLLSDLAQEIVRERHLRSEVEIRHQFLGELRSLQESMMEDEWLEMFEDLLPHAEARYAEYLRKYEEQKVRRQELEGRSRFDSDELRRILKRGAAAIPESASRQTEDRKESTGDSALIDGTAMALVAESTEAGELAAGRAGTHRRSIAEADAQKAGPTPEREGIKETGPTVKESSRTPSATASGGPGSPGGSGSAGTSVSQPSFAFVAAMQLRKVRQRGTFELDMSKYMAGAQTIKFDQPIGDLRRYKDDDAFFRQISLDQLIFRQREVNFQLVGLNAEDFGDYVNFVSVQLRRGESVREEHTVGADEFNQRGDIFGLIYGFSGEETRDEWNRYEYRTVWSLFRGLRVEEPWQETTDDTVALAPPYLRRTVDLEGDPEKLDGIRAITVKLYYSVGEEERFSETLLRPDRGETVGAADVLLPEGETTYDYEILWQSGNQPALSSGRQTTSNPILLLNPPEKGRR